MFEHWTLGYVLGMGVASYLLGRYIWLTKKKKRPPSGMIMICLCLVVLSLADAGALNSLSEPNDEISDMEYHSITQLIEKLPPSEQAELLSILEGYLDDGRISKSEKNEILAFYTNGNSSHTSKKRLLKFLEYDK